MAVIQQMDYMQIDWEDTISRYEALVEENRYDVNSLRDWATKQPHLPQLSDVQLYFFLKLADMNVEKAKDITDRYVTLKTHNPKLFKGRFDDMVLVKNALHFAIVSSPCAYKIQLRGHRICHVKLNETDASKLNFSAAMMVFTAAMDFEFARNPFHKGLIAVLDASGFNFGFIPKVNLMLCAVVFKYLQLIENLIKEVHIINCNPVVTHVYALVRPFISKHLASLLHFHSPSGLNDFYKKHVPLTHMPADYGGDLPSYEESDCVFRTRFLDAKEWFDEVDSEKYYVKESERPSNQKQQLTLKGSFRQLLID